MKTTFCFTLIILILIAFSCKREVTEINTAKSGIVSNATANYPNGYVQFIASESDTERFIAVSQYKSIFTSFRIYTSNPIDTIWVSLRKSAKNLLWYGPQSNQPQIYANGNLVVFKKASDTIGYALMHKLPSNLNTGIDVPIQATLNHISTSSDSTSVHSGAVYSCTLYAVSAGGKYFKDSIYVPYPAYKLVGSRPVVSILQPAVSDTGTLFGINFKSVGGWTVQKLVPIKVKFTGNANLIGNMSIVDKNGNVVTRSFTYILVSNDGNSRIYSLIFDFGYAGYMVTDSTTLWIKGGKTLPKGSSALFLAGNLKNYNWFDNTYIVYDSPHGTENETYMKYDYSYLTYAQYYNY